MGFVVVKVELGQVSTECPTLIIIYHLGLVTGQMVADIPSGHSLSAHQKTKKNKCDVRMLYEVFSCTTWAHVSSFLVITATALTALKRVY
jgi:hypothetical protein